MKPVEIEDFTARIKRLTADLLPMQDTSQELTTTLADIESQLQSMDDAKESKVLLAVLTVLLLPLAAYLIYIGFYWPSLVAVAWLGALLYYRANERSLSIATLTEKAKITPYEHGSKVNYLLAGVHQKQGRLSLMKIYNIVFWPFAVFMGQLVLNTDLSSLILWVILLVIFAANAAFWYTNYRPVDKALGNLEQALHTLNYELIMSSTATQSAEEE